MPETVVARHPWRALDAKNGLFAPPSGLHAVGRDALGKGVGGDYQLGKTPAAKKIGESIRSTKSTNPDRVFRFGHIAERPRAREQIPNAAGPKPIAKRVCLGGSADHQHVHDDAGRKSSIARTLPSLSHTSTSTSTGAPISTEFARSCARLATCSAKGRPSIP